MNLDDRIKNQDEMMQSLMRSRVINTIASLPGSTLTAVRYWCLKGESEEDIICAPDYYLGGEIELVCTQLDSSVRITWDENAGFWGHFSVCALTGSKFLPETLKAFDASDCPVWRPHIGKRIKSVRVFGLDDVPFVVVITFSSGAVSIGSSSGTRFGDGDDVFIEPFNLHSLAMEGLSEMWDSK